MKKFFILATAILATCTMVSAENTTRIGAKHRIDYGAVLGWAQNDLAWYGMAFLDINAAGSNFRTRINLGLAERNFWLKGKTAGLNPNAAIDFQYLLPLSETLYLYPSIGIYGEHFSEKTGHTPLDNIGAEFGGGLEFQFTSGFGIFAQGDYQWIFTAAPSRFSARAGVIMHF